MAQTAMHAHEDRLVTGKLGISLLGPLTVRREGRDLDVAGPRRRALLTLLALNAGRPLGRDQIVEALWPRRQTGREESTLRTHVSYLRDGIEPDRGNDPVFLVTRGQTYMLDASRIDLDLDRFGALAEEGRSRLATQPDQALTLFDEALALWRGRPLQDVEYEDFAQDEIRKLEKARVDTVVDRARALVASGNLGPAVAALEPLVREEPEWEDPAILLMRALYGRGRQADALRVARRHRRHLADHGLEPSPRLVQIEDQILDHHPGLISIGDGVAVDATGGPRGYELRDRVGEGSIGAVYRAFQPSVGREVALKVVHPDLAASGDFVRRFADAAKVVAGLEHPHIVPLYDFWRDPSGAFLVMRWIGGGSLADRLGRQWDTSELARVFEQVADALSYAHSAGIAHRNVKATNVLFDRSGNAYLGDFGLATWVVETGARSSSRRWTGGQPNALPETSRREGPTVASDIYALGALLAEALRGLDSDGDLATALAEVVRVATSVDPADRFPDAEAFRRALADAFGDVQSPLPRKVRRNPYKGLKPFDEGDVADFYGRGEFIEHLLTAVATQGLVAVVAASGTGKSSVVRAGLTPELRDGAIPGSDEWFLVTMVPGVEPFDEFRVALRAAAMADSEPLPYAPERELRAAFDSALDGPSSKAVLVIDQFEELFSSDVDPDVRDRFLDNLVDLATDPARRVRTVVTLRADFSDRPLSHPRFGGLMAKASLMLGPMTPDELEDVIRLPAARAGVDVVPGLVSEILRDLSTAPASLPLLQYILTELFERRVEDRLTVQAYRALGGVQGVLERQAEAAYNSLPADATSTCRQLFLRMVQLGDLGEETRRRVARTELSGLGEREAIDEVIDAFTIARILTSDRDPVSRVPTIEVSHETVITRWTRFRVWMGESRADLAAQRRIAIAADTWTTSGEDPEYLLTGGPMSAVVELTDSRRVSLNETEARFVEASRAAAADAEAHEQERQRREADLEHRSRRRLALGIGTAMIAAVVAVLAGFAWFERQRANDLAAAQERQSTARELAATSIANLDSADPDLSLLLAIEAAELTVEAGEDVLSEVVEALHRAVIRVRPVVTIHDALGDTHGEGLSYSGTGSLLAYVTDEGAIAAIDPGSGSEVFRTSRVDPPAFGVDFHPSGGQFMSIHRDGVREWIVGVSEMSRWIPHHPAPVTTATSSDDGRLVAVGDDTGTITVYARPDEVVARLSGGHTGPINSVDFDPAGTRLVSAGSDPRVLVWDLDSKVVTTELQVQTDSCAYEASWHPQTNEIVATLCSGEAFAFDAETGVKLRPFSMANQVHAAMVHDLSGMAVAGAGSDGIARIFNNEVGGSSIIDLPNGGAPVGDIEFNPLDPASLEVAALGLDGTIQIWRDGAAWSELPDRFTLLRKPFIEATPDGRHYVVGSNSRIPGTSCDEVASVLLVIDAATETVLAEPKTLCTAGQLHRGAIADDGELVAAAGLSGNVFVLDVGTGASTEIPDSASWSLDLDFSSDSRLLAGAGLDGLIVVWDLESTSRVITMSPGPKDLESAQQLLSDRTFVQVAFRPDSNELVTAGVDGSVRVWDLDDGSNRTLHTFDSPLSSFDISLDGASVVGADTTGDVRLFDLDTGEEILPRPQAVAGGTSVVFSPDGHLLAGGGPGPVIYLWDLRSGEIHRRMGRSIGRPTVAFVNGGAEIRAASLEGIVRGYVLDPIELLGIAREKVGRELSDEECERYLRRGCEG